jgi:hypothetical protein
LRQVGCALNGAQGSAFGSAIGVAAVGGNVELNAVGDGRCGNEADDGEDSGFHGLVISTFDGTGMFASKPSSGTPQILQELDRFIKAVCFNGPVRMAAESRKPSPPLDAFQTDVSSAPVRHREKARLLLGTRQPASLRKYSPIKNHDDAHSLKDPRQQALHPDCLSPVDRCRFGDGGQLR